MSRSTASRWFRLWSSGGAEVLGAGRPRGPAPRLSAEELGGVRDALARPPRDAGFDLEHWSLAAVVALIDRHTGVTYHPRHVARVVRRLGWIVPPVGAAAAHAFREADAPAHDPDGAPIRLREVWPSR